MRILVDPLSAQYVEGAQVDYVDGLMGRGFTVTNPNYASQGRRLRRRLLVRRPLSPLPRTRTEPSRSSPTLTWRRSGRPIGDWPACTTLT